MFEIVDGGGSLSLSLLLPPHGFADTEWSGETETIDLCAYTGILEDPLCQLRKETKSLKEIG